MCTCIHTSLSLSLSLYIYICTPTRADILFVRTAPVALAWRTTPSLILVAVCMNVCCSFTLLDLHASSLCRGHAKLLCIVPILTDSPLRESMCECVHVCMSIYVRVRVRTCEYMCVRVCVCVCACSCVSLCCLCACVHVYVWLCIDGLFAKRIVNTGVCAKTSFYASLCPEVLQKKLLSSP